MKKTIEQTACYSTDDASLALLVLLVLVLLFTLLSRATDLAAKLTRRLRTGLARPGK